MSWQNNANGPQQPWGQGPQNPPRQPYPTQQPYPNQQQYPPQRPYPNHQGGNGQQTPDPRDQQWPAPGGPPDGRPKGPGRVVLFAVVALVAAVMLVAGIHFYGPKADDEEAGKPMSTGPASEAPQTPSAGPATPELPPIELGGGISVTPEPEWKVISKEDFTASLAFDPGQASLVATVSRAEGLSVEQLSELLQNQMAKEEPGRSAQKTSLQRVKTNNGLDVARSAVRVTKDGKLTNHYITVGVNPKAGVAVATILSGPANMTMDADSRMTAGANLTDSALDSLAD